jgi:hypothetical protein
MTAQFLSLVGDADVIETREEMDKYLRLKFFVIDLYDMQSLFLHLSSVLFYLPYLNMEVKRASTY